MLNPLNLNNWDACQAAKAAGCRRPDITISYSPANWPNDGSWVVERSGTYEKKHFPGTKAHEKGLQAAKDWASRMYGISDWVKIPGMNGTYFPAENVPAIKAAMKAPTRPAKTA